MRASRSILATLLAMIILGPSALMAQGTGTIRGRVVDSTTQRPISDVQVSVTGTAIGGATTLNGEFTLINVPAGDRTVSVRRIGYSPASRVVTVPSNGETRADFALNITATELDQVVVTGTAGGSEKRTLGNAIATLDVAEVARKAPVLNVSEILQGKIAGVTLLPGSGVPGTAGEIRIRGAGSVSAYKPVIYIDGIRYNTESLGNFAATGSGTAGLAQSTQVTSALDFISPDDIESIEVLKGPAAATLYGAEAANGVIQIITKKGTRGQQPLRWTVRVDRGETKWHLDTPFNYTSCDAVKRAQLTGGLPTWPGCQGKPDTLLTDEPMVRDGNALRVGSMQKYSLSMTGGGDRYSFYVAADRDLDEGVYYNSYNSRLSTRGNFTFVSSEQLDFSILLNYIQGDLRLPIGDESPNGILLSAARGKPGRITGSPLIGEGWSTIDPLRANAYNNQTESDRLTLGATVNYTPFTWLRNRVTIGVDNTVAQASLLFLPGDEGEPSGASLGRTPITRILSIDYAGNVPIDITPNLQSTTSFGTQIVANRVDSLNATGTGLGAPDVTRIGSAATTSGGSGFAENNSVGYYLQEQVGWNNRLFVTGAVRADDHSSFGTNFDWIVYPKFSVSWVLSEEPSLQDWVDRARITTFKLRSAWGRAGRAPSAYSATQTYTVDRVTLGGVTGSALRILAYGNPDLKPEKGEEIEIGFDAGLFDERVGVDFTYYDKKTTDMLVSVATAPSSGFPVNRLSNLGKVTNRGLELGVSASVVQLDRFGWDTRLTYSTNANRLSDFGIPGRVSENPPGQAYAVVQQHRRGYPLGGYWAQFPRRNPDGTPVLLTSGALSLDTATYIGPSAPTREAGFSNTFTIFRDFRLYGLLDYKGGHYLFNQRERNRCQTANDNCWATNEPRARNPQTAADTILFRELAVWRGAPAVFIEPADFVKLREISLSYTVPSAWIGRLGASAATFTISGRNLAVWSDYSGPDPEVSSYGGRLFVRADAYAPPMARRFVGSITLTY